MSSFWLAGYVAGVPDGWSEAASKEVMEGKSDSVWLKVLSCITMKKMTHRQMVAITESMRKSIRRNGTRKP
jgi:hypothetical protein